MDARGAREPERRANQDAVHEWVPRFEGRLVGTTQSKPLKDVHNFGGFTDGDRCAFLCDHFGAVAAILVAFNFDDTDQEYLRSLGKTKLLKLTWGGMLLSALERSEVMFFEDIVDVNRNKEIPWAPRDGDTDALVHDIVDAYSRPPDDGAAK